MWLDLQSEVAAEFGDIGERIDFRVREVLEQRAKGWRARSQLDRYARAQSQRRRRRQEKRARRAAAVPWVIAAPQKRFVCECGEAFVSDWARRCHLASKKVNWHGKRA